jgi:thiol-disulfide isomerase/thioredoxin
MQLNFKWESFQLGSVLFLAIAIVLSACGGEVTQDDNTDEGKEKMAEADDSDDQSAASLPPIFTTFDGIESLFTKQNDSTYLINFWATWCKPCVEELPYIEQLHEDFAGQKLGITLVSLDFPNKLESDLLPFMEKKQLKSDVVVLLDEDYNTWLDKVDPAWGGAIPVTVVYNAEKRVFIERKFDSYEELKELVEEYL